MRLVWEVLEMRCKLDLLHSLEKVFFAKPLHIEQHTTGSMLKNEIYSFQLACWGVEDSEKQRVKCKVRIQSALEPYIKVYQVGYVPSLLPGRLDDDEDYITKEPGLFPDPLYPVQDGVIELCATQARALWIVVEPQGEMTGVYPIQIQILDLWGNTIGEACFTLEIIDAGLPELDICNTGWIHGDCLAKLHHVSILSEAYFDILKKYIQTYVKFGHNMILTPVFTPPLDTEIGGERATNQLVDVKCENGTYTFGFGNLKRWMDMCRACGIQYFEISHLFTQWGAYHAPKIMATVDGEYKRIFGWETDALSAEYTDFLKAFLPELVCFLSQEQVLDNTYFHISDEPGSVCEAQYKAERDIVASYIEPSKILDALSNYSFCKKGILTSPIVAIDHIQPFLEDRPENLWAYYCMAQGDKVSNRFMAMPSYRNRILGYQLYKYDIEGFLQWGFNFWFSQLSKEVINPYLDTAAGGEFPSGDAFMVYPLNEEGEVICSLRLYVFHEALQDMRALKLLESKYDRQTVLELLKDIEGFSDYPRCSSYIVNLRERINRMLMRTIS